MREGEAHEREIHVYIHIYIYTFAHSGVRQVSNAIINYPTVFCYRACAPPYLSPLLRCVYYILSASEIPILVSPSPDSSFFSTAKFESALCSSGERDFFPIFFLSFSCLAARRQVSRSMRENFARSLSLLGLCRVSADNNNNAHG